MMEMVKSRFSYKLVVSEYLEKKIRHLCQNISAIEWSGMLFYKSSGEFSDGSLVITAVDLVLLDIGVSTYTEFDITPEVINYQVEHDLLDCSVGLIHSHNNMKAFFSGTDLNTLNEYGESMNHFVSLIVCNEGTYVAAITRKVLIQRSIVQKSIFKSFDDEHKEDRLSYTDESEVIEYFNLDIEVENRISFTELDKRIEEIRKEKRTAPRSVPYGQTHINFGDEDDGTAGKVYIPPKQEEPEEKKEPVPISKQVLDDMIVQLVTGSVTVRSGKINLQEWVTKNMDSVFKKRFSGPSGMDFTEWAEFIVEYLVYDGMPENTTELEVESAGIAGQLSKELRKFKKNPWIEKYLEITDRLAEFE